MSREGSAAADREYRGPYQIPRTRAVPASFRRPKAELLRNGPRRLRTFCRCGTARRGEMASYSNHRCHATIDRKSPAQLAAATGPSGPDGVRGLPEGKRDRELCLAGKVSQHEGREDGNACDFRRLRLSRGFSPLPDGIRKPCPTSEWKPRKGWRVHDPTVSCRQRNVRRRGSSAPRRERAYPAFTARRRPV